MEAALIPSIVDAFASAKIPAGTRELVAHQHYVLVYDVAGDVVRVLRVLHTARQWPPVRG